MKCKFCYAIFDDMKVKIMPLSDAAVIIQRLAESGLQKITFAGGEPLMYPYIKEVIRYAKRAGLTTSIITNGSLLTTEWLSSMFPFLDWVGLSIDSLNSVTQEKIGRVAKVKPTYRELITHIHQLDYKLKINTVVNRYNFNEDMNHFINWAKPDRWKVFQALRVEGQNDKQFDRIKVDANQYKLFLDRHNNQPALVPEDNEAMTGSYLLIDPQGRLFENSLGKHTYSSPLQKNDIDHCLSEINLNREMFIKRGGLYKW